MYAVFRDSAANEQFLRTGYFTQPLLDASEVAMLQDGWDTLPDKPTAPFAFGFFSNNVASKRQAHELVCDLVGARTAPLLNNYAPLYGQYVLKRSMAESGFTVHQDWSFADERRFVTLNVWIPLVDVNEENGALFVLPGSQSNRTVRGPGIPSPCDDILDLPFDGFRCIELRAGEAIVFDSALLHRSPPNLSACDRVAVSLISIPASAEAAVNCSTCGEPTEFVDVRHINSSFFLEKGLDPTTFPKVGAAPYVPTRLSATSLVASSVGHLD